MFGRNGVSQFVVRNGHAMPAAAKHVRFEDSPVGFRIRINHETLLGIAFRGNPESRDRALTNLRAIDAIQAACR
ncbi:MAG: hypothetical protein WC734_01780 [Patescibacteria group bacterium]